MRHRMYSGNGSVSRRAVPDAGIAIGIILFIVALLGVVTVAMSSGSNTVGSTIVMDRVRSDIKSQANLIRAKILECNMYSAERGELADKYPASTGAGTAVDALECLAYDSSGVASSLTPLWTGAHSATLPAPPSGFDKWYYKNDGVTGGRCIRIQPLAPNVGDAGIKAGLVQASAAFSDQEADYLPASASQRFILWITAPSGAATTDCSS